MIKRFLQIILFSSVMLLFGGTNNSIELAASDAPSLYLHRNQSPIPNPQSPAPSPQTPAPNLQSPISTHQIIQFHAPITLNDRERLLDSGVQILEYLPDYAYLVTGSAAQLGEATQGEAVYRAVPFTLADKLSPNILAQLGEAEAFVDVGLFDWNGRFLTTIPSLPTDQLWTVAANPNVRWIEAQQPLTLFNDEARKITNVNPVWQTLGLYGAGQIVAIADSGLDTGDFATISPDFAPSRIVAGIPLVDGESWDDNFGHGTHVAGSLLGAGVQSGATPANQQYADSYAGVAPEASLVVQAFEAASDGSITGLGDDLYAMFQQAYDAGARIHSNSWGGTTGESGDAQYGGYPALSQRTDAFVWDNPDMSIFFAAGNSGTDGSIDQICLNGDGVVDSDSMAAPGTAKNVITVGASENMRSEGGAGSFNWFLLGCFFFPPIGFDTVANDPNGMAAFSSRGPVDDGRIKPDIVAPGTNILSNRSHVDGASALWAAHEPNEHYTYSGGTSMATPLAAGMGTLLREWLVEEGFTDPSAALLKALLLNGAVDIAPGQYGEGDSQEIPSAWPNSVAGWGRADVGFLVDGERPFFHIDETSGLETGQQSDPIAVTASDQTIRIHLVWTDPPASLSAAKQLVNDLDLRVIAPDGTLLYGNRIDGGDRINNVEGLIIRAPQDGNYTIIVRAHNVPMGPQPYALVVSGAAEGDAPEPSSEEPNLIFMPFVVR